MLNSIQSFNYQINQRQTMPKTTCKQSLPVLSTDTVSFSGNSSNEMTQLAKKLYPGFLNGQRKLFLKFTEEAPSFKEAVKLIQKGVEYTVAREYTKDTVAQDQVEKKVLNTLREKITKFMSNVESTQKFWPEKVSEIKGEDRLSFHLKLFTNHPELADEYLNKAQQQGIISQDEHAIIKAKAQADGLERQLKSYCSSISEGIDTHINGFLDNIVGSLNPIWKKEGMNAGVLRHPKYQEVNHWFGDKKQTNDFLQVLQEKGVISQPAIKKIKADAELEYSKSLIEDPFYLAQELNRFIRFREDCNRTKQREERVILDSIIDSMRPAWIEQVTNKEHIIKNWINT